MSPFARLGLSEDADEAQIKRAYARELRTARPDSDPQAFQRLREAYATCLESARRHATMQTMQPTPTPGPSLVADETRHSNVAPASRTHVLETTQEPVKFESVPPQRPASQASASPSGDACAHAGIDDDATVDAIFDPNRFIERLIERAHALPAEAFEGWLRQCPELLPVERKPALAPALINGLVRSPTLYRSHLDVALDHFGLDTVQPGFAVLQPCIAELRARANARGADLRQLQFDPNPRQGKRGHHSIWSGIPWGAIAFLLMMLMVSIAKAMRLAYGS